MTRYIPRDGWVEGINLPGFSNRYLYCTPTSVYVMAGDRPLLRLAEKRRLLGTLQLLCAEKALQDCADVHMRYRPGMAEWIIRDPAFDGEIKVTAVTAGRITGMAVKVESPVEIRFTYGGLSYYSPDGAKEGGDFWNLNVKYGDAPLTAVVFDEAWLEDNTAVWDDAHKSLILSAPTAKRQVYVCSDAPLSTDGVMVSGTFGTYFAATLSESDARTLKKQEAEGVDLALRFTKEAERDRPVTIAHISAAENGRCVVVLEGKDYLQEVTMLRQQRVQIVTGTVEGLRIPKEALHAEKTSSTDEGTAKTDKVGVYCIVGMEARFKPIEVVYTGDTFVLVRANAPADRENLRLRPGDEVIIAANNLFDGKVVG